MPGMDLNFFKFCSGLRVLGYFMILLVAAIVAVSYHAVVVLTWAPQLLRHGGHSASASAILVAFHVLLVLLLWSYLRVLLVDPGSVPENWRPVLSEGNLESGACVNASAPLEALSSMRPASDRLDGGAAAGYCNRCQNGKPPRCHHCSVCQRCVLKMDHHCVWVVNCVGACNYKFFLLFLLYTFLETTMDTLVLLPNFIKFFTKAREASLPPGNLAVIFVAFDCVP